MECILYKTTSNEKTLHKDLTQIKSVSVEWKANTNILHPTIILGGEIPTANYVYIPTFNRYYFIKDMRIMKARNVIEIDCDVDVLMSYANKLSELECVVARQENEYNTYLADNSFLAYSYPSIVQKAFPNGFTNQSHLILTVAGGGANG